jgi:hypothetical protein
MLYSPEPPMIARVGYESMRNLLLKILLIVPEKEMKAEGAIKKTTIDNRDTKVYFKN